MTKVLARVVDGHVVELVRESKNIADEWTPAFLAACIDVTSVAPQPVVGWTYANSQFAAPEPFVPSAQQQMTAALMAGCRVASTATPTLDATYDAVGPRWSQMLNEVIYITAFSKFSGALSELDWPAASGEVVFTAVDEFKTVTAAIGDWQTAWQRHVDGKGDAPTLPVMIA